MKASYQQLDFGDSTMRMLSLIPTQQQTLALQSNNGSFDVKIIKDILFTKTVLNQPVCLPIMMHARFFYELIKHYILCEHRIVIVKGNKVRVVILRMMKHQSYLELETTDALPLQVAQKILSMQQFFTNVAVLRYTQIKLINARETPYNVFVSDGNYSINVVKKINFECIAPLVNAKELRQAKLEVNFDHISPLVPKDVFDSLKYLSESQFNNAVAHAAYCVEGMKKYCQLIDHKIKPGLDTHVVETMQIMKDYLKELRQIHRMPLRSAQEEYQTIGYLFSPRLALHYPLYRRFNAANDQGFSIMIKPVEENFRRISESTQKVRNAVMQRILGINSLSANEARRGVQSDSDWVDEDVIIVWRGLYLRFC